MRVSDLSVMSSGDRVVDCELERTLKISVCSGAGKELCGSKETDHPVRNITTSNGGLRMGPRAEHWIIRAPHAQLRARTVGAGGSQGSVLSAAASHRCERNGRRAGDLLR